MTRKELVNFLIENFEENQNVGLCILDPEPLDAPIEIENFSCAIKTITVRDNNGEWKIGKTGAVEWVSYGKPFFRKTKAIEVKF